jgi:hypothetical protein
MRPHVAMFLIIVNLKFWKVTVTSPLLVHLNSRNLVPGAETVLILFSKPGICSDNSQKTQDAERLFQIRPVCEYFLHKYRSVYSPKPELSREEAMNSLWGRLKFLTYNARRITKMVCEAKSGYVCNMDIYAAEGQNLEDTVLSRLDRNLGHNHHIYLDNYYDSVKVAETLLDRKWEFVAL